MLVPSIPKLTKVRFRAGPYGRTSGLTITPGSVLILVGPNNSGKTQCLRDTENLCVTQQKGPVVEEIDAQFPEDEHGAIRLLNRLQRNPPAGQVVPTGSVFLSATGPQGGQNTAIVNLEEFRRIIQKRDKHALRTLFLPRLTLRLDVRTRFELVSDKEAGDLQSPETNHLQALFRSDEARKKVQSLVYEAFGHHLLVDPTGMSTLRLRLGPEAPASAEFERSLTTEAVKFFGEASHISEFSDGVQAFVGLVTALYALPHSILLVDEPDAFLHPSLSRRIGEELTLLAENRGGSLVVATHSAEFVLGCVETSEDVSIVRLTFDANSATATELPPQEIKDMMRRPILRSARVLDALFHRAAVVTEGDADRAFYDEINRRLLAESRGILDVLFLSSFGIGQIFGIVSPLRRLGLPTAAIVDLDFLSHHENEWESLFKAGRIPIADWPELLVRKKLVVDTFSKSDGDTDDQLKTGLRSLQKHELDNARSFLSSLEEFGIFLVEVGELEGWLGDLRVQTGPAWIVRMFDRLAANSAEQDVRPGQGDVWDFLDRIAEWIRQPNRRGLAS